MLFVLGLGFWIVHWSCTALPHSHIWRTIGKDQAEFVRPIAMNLRVERVTLQSSTKCFRTQDERSVSPGPTTALKLVEGLLFLVYGVNGEFWGCNTLHHGESIKASDVGKEGCCFG